MPLFPMNTGFKPSEDTTSDARHPSVQVKNRRKRYLDLHPEYFSADLELAGPLALSLLPTQTWPMCFVQRWIQCCELTAEPKFPS